MPVAITKEDIKQKLKKSLKDTLSEEQIDTIAEVIYDDVYKNLDYKTETKADKYDVSAGFQELRSEIRLLAETMKVGFEHINKRFEDLIHYIDKRFEDMNKRFEDMNKKINLLIWVVSLWMGFLSLITVLIRTLNF